MGESTRDFWASIKTAAAAREHALNLRGKTRAPCQRCNGRGHTEPGRTDYDGHSPGGFYVMPVDCRACFGAGRVEVECSAEVEAKAVESEIKALRKRLRELKKAASKAVGVGDGADRQRSAGETRGQARAAGACAGPRDPALDAAERGADRGAEDRLDNGRDYSLDNIRVIELAENIGKSKRLRFDNGLGVCRVCKQQKPADEFTGSSRAYTGLTSTCKRCEAARSRVANPRVNRASKYDAVFPPRVMFELCERLGRVSIDELTAALGGNRRKAAATLANHFRRGKLVRVEPGVYRAAGGCRG